MSVPWQKGRGTSRRCHGSPLVPDCGHDDCVAGGDDEGGEEEEGEGDQGHVQLPVPLLGKFNPALSPILPGVLHCEKEEDWEGECSSGEPGEQDKPPCTLPAAGEVHGVGDGIVPVDAERHQDVGGAVGDQQLAELDHPAGGEASLPGDGELPTDVDQDGEQSDAQVCGCKVGDEKVHPRLPRSGVEKRSEDERVAEDDDGEEEPEEGELLRLVEEAGHLLNAAVASSLVDKTTADSCDIVKLKSNCAACSCVFPPVTAPSVVGTHLTHLPSLLHHLRPRHLPLLLPHHCNQFTDCSPRQKWLDLKFWKG